LTFPPIILFAYDWQVLCILSQSEDSFHRLSFFEPRDYRVVFFIQKTEQFRSHLNRSVSMAKANNNDTYKNKLCESKATLTSSFFTITYSFPKIDKSF